MKNLHRKSLSRLPAESLGGKKKMKLLKKSKSILRNCETQNIDERFFISEKSA